MKYKKLTKEQFEALHDEFAKFLATQQIDAAEWKSIKENNLTMAEEELELFSDMVWEDVLAKINYLEHFSEQSINLFKCDKSEMHRIVVQVKKQGFNFFDDIDYKWFIDNTNHTSIDFFKGTKKYTGERNPELFDLIQKGSNISSGSLYENIYKLLHL